MLSKCMKSSLTVLAITALLVAAGPAYARSEKAKDKALIAAQHPKFGCILAFEEALGAFHESFETARADLQSCKLAAADKVARMECLVAFSDTLAGLQELKDQAVAEKDACLLANNPADQTDDNSTDTGTQDPTL